MFELPEYLVLAADMNTVLPGRRVRRANRAISRKVCLVQPDA